MHDGHLSYNVYAIARADSGSKRESQFIYAASPTCQQLFGEILRCYAGGRRAAYKMGLLLGHPHAIAVDGGDGEVARPSGRVLFAVAVEETMSAQLCLACGLPWLRYCSCHRVQLS
ncbi:hypothetical protein GUJ93_ZPchr0012g19970 [Zizania palustris]|uniref:Uncharacterized protein n=1 Tax=Zizania palustris TaxID=103762 RepID=A0A8J5WT03_ZIZPA|nr:hypothetical protein GUJ93_ZPchr0012g19970 [Zizania palustris]